MAEAEPSQFGVKRDVREEKQETIRLLEQRFLAREEKLAQEGTAMSGAPEAEFEERSWHRTRPETLAQIEASVDALGERPPPAAEGPAEPPRWEPSAAPETVAVEPGLKQRISRLVKGEVLQAKVIYRTTSSQVVEVEHRSGKGVERTVFIVTGKKVREVSQVASALDRVEGKREAPPPPPGPAAPGLTAPPPPEEGRRLAPPKLGASLPFRRKKGPEPSEATVADAGEPQKERESGGLLGRGKKLLRRK